ncbi:MAG: hypothetical protein OXU50_02570 [Gammaproteobacteria bacterium]|nr:hypothetical protein [Gammaproteobacteria bacterium]
MEFTKFEEIRLTNHPDLDEKWVQARIAEDPAILGLGEDVILRDKERAQPRAGVLDLLLQDGDWRYEVEVQLGATDPSHIIRTIEYWDIERRRYPQYEHTAVIIAEDITSRFLNVIGLFNGAIPIVAIQMRALKNQDKVGLIFTTVMNQMSLGFEEEDEETYEPVDREYWENRGSKETVAMADEILNLVKEFDGSLELNYNKGSIGMVKNGRSNRFIVFIPRKKHTWLLLRLERSKEITDKLESTGLDVSYKWRRYRLRLRPGEIEENTDTITDLVREAYNAASGG